MGFRFRKSVKIAPGVKVNFGKKSVGMSIGNRYAGVSVNSRTGARARVSAILQKLVHQPRPERTALLSQHNPSFPALSSGNRSPRCAK